MSFKNLVVPLNEIGQTEVGVPSLSLKLVVFKAGKMILSEMPFLNHGWVGKTLQCSLG
jgi:hypothetical protein